MKKGSAKKGGKGKKERLERERVEKEAAEQAEFFRGETAKREHHELYEVLERSELCLRFKEGQTDLMVDRKAYNDLLKKIEERTEAHTQAMKALDNELNLTRKTKLRLEQELTDIRFDHKLMMKAVQKRMKDLEQEMLGTVQKLIDHMETEKDAEAKSVTHNFNLRFGRNKQAYLDLLYEARLKVGHYSEVLIESKSMHSNLPQRVRRQLEQAAKEDLLFMFDALSFEEGVLEYFEAKFPKNQPHRWTPASSPNAQLLVMEVEEAEQAAQRLTTP